jgi:hypothetical protein
MHWLPRCCVIAQTSINFQTNTNNLPKEFYHETSGSTGSCFIHSVHTVTNEEFRSAGCNRLLPLVCDFARTIYQTIRKLCKVWGVHGGYFEKCRLLGYNNQVRTSQEEHYVSATEPSRLMLCKIWGFHGGDYEECRLLGCNNPVRTTQETHYVSTTGLSGLMICKIWGFSRGWLWRMPSYGS